MMGSRPPPGPHHLEVGIISSGAQYAKRLLNIHPLVHFCRTSGPERQTWTAAWGQVWASVWGPGEPQALVAAYMCELAPDAAPRCSQVDSGSR